MNSLCFSETAEDLYKSVENVQKKHDSVCSNIEEARLKNNILTKKVSEAKKTLSNLSREKIQLIGKLNDFSKSSEGRSENFLNPTAYNILKEEHKNLELELMKQKKELMNIDSYFDTILSTTPSSVFSSIFEAKAKEKRHAIEIASISLSCFEEQLFEKRQELTRVNNNFEILDREIEKDQMILDVTQNEVNNIKLELRTLQNFIDAAQKNIFHLANRVACDQAYTLENCLDIINGRNKYLDNEIENLEKNKKKWEYDCNLIQEVVNL